MKKFTTEDRPELSENLIRDKLIEGLAPITAGVWRGGIAPVEPRDFIISPLYYNAKEEVYPKVLEAIEKLCAPSIRQGICIWGKGSGKSFATSCAHGYGIYYLECMNNPQRYLGLAPNSPIYFVNVATNENQAKKVFFTEFGGRLKNSGWFKEVEHEPSAPNEYQVLTLEIRFYNNIFALCANSFSSSWLGFNVIQFVCDELCWFRENERDEEAASTAESVWESLLGSCMSHGNFGKFYKAIGISSPRYDDDFGMRKFRELKARAELQHDAFALQAPTWEMNPKSPFSSFAFSYKQNPELVMRDFGAQPTRSIQAFFPDPTLYRSKSKENIRNNFNKEIEKFSSDYVPTETDNPLHIHVDLGVTRDHCGIAGAKFVGTKKEEIITTEGNKEVKQVIEQPIAKIDFLIDINPRTRSRFVREGGQIDFASVAGLIIELVNRGFIIDTVSFDRFQSTYIKQQLEDHGIVVEELSVDKTDAVANECKSALLTDRLEIFYDEELEREITGLIWIKGGKVDHMRKGAGKDVWDAVAGACYRVLTKSINSGAEFFFAGEEDKESLTSAIGID